MSNNLANVHASITLNLHDTAFAVAACAIAGHTPLILGPPGIAKTTMMRALAPVIGAAIGVEGEYPFETCILSNRDAVDVGGYPMVIGERVEQKLFGTLRRAAERASYLGLDEFLTCPQSVQGPAMRLVLEGYAGELPLHPDTRIVCAANPPDQAPGGIQMTAALVNRLIIINCVPTVAEVAMYFRGDKAASLSADVIVPSAEARVEQRARLMNTAGVLFEVRPDLLCFSPPAASISDGEPFASPRAWEICCDVLAVLPPGMLDGDNPIMQAIVLGSIGPVAGIAYLSTVRSRQYLPSIQDILANPTKAKLPDENTRIVRPDGTTSDKTVGRDVTFAAIPLLIEVAQHDTYAAWCYAKRLPDEIRAAVSKALTATVKSPKDSPWRAEGQKIMLETIRQTAQSDVRAAN